MTEEIWKDIEEFEDFYQVSSLERVRSLDRIVKGPYGFRKIKGKILKPDLTHKGYLKVDLWKNRKIKTISLHRLIAKAFIPNPKNLPEINHKNGIKTDNRIKNLEWCSRIENVIHADENGFFKKGEEHSSAKLTPKEILEIRKKYIPRKYIQDKLAKEYGVSRALISLIIKRERWGHIKEEDDFFNPK